MSELNEANDVLGDPEKRFAYDTLGSAGYAQNGRGGGGAGDGRDFRPPPYWDAGFEFSNGGDSGGDHNDFFEQLLGRGARGQRAQSSGFGTGPEQMRGRDHHAKIELDILDAYDGAERTITLRSARKGDDGHLVNEERSLQDRRPPG